MKQQLEALRAKAVETLSSVNTAAELEEFRVKVLGKKGELTAILRQMGSLSAEERPVMGALANEVRAYIEGELARVSAEVEKKAVAARIAAEKIDVTEPGITPKLGKAHPLTLVRKELENIFTSMGFMVAEGPEVELSHYNFDALNTPDDHPARDMQDTFYIAKDVLLRTQTSSVQARYMEAHKPPLRMICPGAVYRSDAVDATHSPFFHQIEGLVVDKNISFGDLKGTLEEFARLFFGPETRVRFRPHHFPFTEPSAEMDVSCFVCGGKGCRLCKGEGFIEILGAGVVHPNVLRACGIDPDVYSGFAFGMGQERLAMLRYKIDDMRLLFENDVRFLEQF
ncbi:MAG: phenylalanine--tRNA ligase subunit alpha [Clostridia bacterium]|nr:phenylalanine--tRNA ligase subunit alpha [Clostridia bacterium]